MAQQPERPQEFVCENCNNIVAGVVSGDPPNHTYEAPTDCMACGSSEFVAMEQYSVTP